MEKITLYMPRSILEHDMDMLTGKIGRLCHEIKISRGKDEDIGIRCGCLGLSCHECILNTHHASPWMHHPEKYHLKVYDKPGL